MKEFYCLTYGKFDGTIETMYFVSETAMLHRFSWFREYRENAAWVFASRYEENGSFYLMDLNYGKDGYLKLL